MHSIKSVFCFLEQALSSGSWSELCERPVEERDLPHRDLHQNLWKEHQKIKASSLSRTSDSLHSLNACHIDYPAPVWRFINHGRMILRPFGNSLWCFLRADGSLWRWTLRRSSWRCVAPRRRSWRRCRACTRAWSLTHGVGWRILSRSSRTRFWRSRRRRSGWSRTCCNLITEASFCAPKLLSVCTLGETCARGAGLWTGSDSVKGHSLVGCVSLCSQKKKTHGGGTAPCVAPEVHIVSSGNVLTPEILIYYSPEAKLLSIKHYPSQHSPVMLNIVLPTAFCLSFILADLCITVNSIRCNYCCSIEYVVLIFKGTLHTLI